MHAGSGSWQARGNTERPKEEVDASTIQKHAYSPKSFMLATLAPTLAMEGKQASRLRPACSTTPAVLLVGIRIYKEPHDTSKDGSD